MLTAKQRNIKSIHVINFYIKDVYLIVQSSLNDNIQLNAIKFAVNEVECNEYVSRERERVGKDPINNANKSRKIQINLLLFTHDRQ